MFLFLHLNTFVIGVRTRPRVRVHILRIGIYIPYPRDSFSLCFWKISVIKLRRPSSFLISTERELCWDHDGKSLSCQDMLSSGKKVRSAPHTISQVPPLSLDIIYLTPFHLSETSGYSDFISHSTAGKSFPGTESLTCTQAECLATLSAKTNQHQPRNPNCGAGTVPKRELGCSCIIFGDPSLLLQWKSWLAPKSCCDPDNAPSASSPCMCCFHLHLTRDRHRHGVFLLP